MAEKLPPVPTSAPITDEKNAGIVTQVWLDWFKKAFNRMGGHIADSNDVIGASGYVSFSHLLSTDWTASKAASGYQKLGSGLYVQWGVTSSLLSATTTTITLPVAFPTGGLQVIAGVRGNTATSTAATGHYGTGNYTTTTFDLYNRTSIALTFNYLAVGY